MMTELLSLASQHDHIVLPYAQLKQWPIDMVTAVENIGWIQLKQTKPSITTPPPQPMDQATSNTCPGLLGSVLPICVTGKLGSAVESSQHLVLSPSIVQPIIGSTHCYLSREQVVQWLATELGFIHQPTDTDNKAYQLCTKSRDNIINIAIVDMSDPVCLFIAGQAIPLKDIVSINHQYNNDDADVALEELVIQLDINKLNAITTQNKPMIMLDQFVQQRLATERKIKAKKAANARHRQPGGSHEKKQELLGQWASGKYRSRNQCAEKVAPQIGLSCSTARKLLANVPDPKRCN